MNTDKTTSSITIMTLSLLALLHSWLPVSQAHAQKPHNTTQAAPDSSAAKARSLPWIISAREARQHHTKGALFIDVRKRKAYDARHIRGAVHTTWQRFASHKIPHIGKLHPKRKVLQKRLRALGVHQRRAVIVYGAPLSGWGEEGRIVWMLRSLGHHRAAFVDGGYIALTKASFPTSQTPATPPTGDFVVKVTSRWSIYRMQLHRLLLRQTNNSVVVDTRELREYNGATPYGEARGGHLPGAIHVHYKSLLNAQGRLLPRKELRKKLTRAGIKPSQQIIAYCTGGIRSAWFVAVLISLGYPEARNYAGSMWEWSYYPATTHLLTR